MESSSRINSSLRGPRIGPRLGHCTSNQKSDFWWRAELRPRSVSDGWRDFSTPWWYTVPDSFYYTGWYGNWMFGLIHARWTLIVTPLKHMYQQLALRVLHRSAVSVHGEMACPIPLSSLTANPRPVWIGVCLTRFPLRTTILSLYINGDIQMIYISIIFTIYIFIYLFHLRLETLYSHLAIIAWEILIDVRNRYPLPWAICDLPMNCHYRMFSLPSKYEKKVSTQCRRFKKKKDIQKETKQSWPTGVFGSFFISALVRFSVGGWRNWWSLQGITRFQCPPSIEDLDQCFIDKELILSYRINGPWSNGEWNTYMHRNSQELLSSGIRCLDMIKRDRLCTLIEISISLPDMIVDKLMEKRMKGIGKVFESKVELLLQFDLMQVRWWDPSSNLPHWE